MKHFLCIPVLVCLLGCSKAAGQSATQQYVASGQEPSTLLIEASSTDFYQHTSKSIQFRSVRLGYLLTPESEKQFLICGEFLPVEVGANGAWSRFATIRTDGYEQWLGAQAAGICDQASIVWEESQEDLSGRLKSAFDAL
jgi:hypothetical protein